MMLPTLLVAALLGEPCVRATGLEAGNVAPCSGALIPTSALTRLLQDQSALDIVRAELQAEKQQRWQDATVCRQHFDIEHKGRLQCESEKTPLPPAISWYEHPAFVAVTSVILTAVVTIGIAYAVK